MDSSQITDLRTTLDFLAEPQASWCPLTSRSTRISRSPASTARSAPGLPTAPPTQIGPAMMFNKVKGSSMRVVAVSTSPAENAPPSFSAVSQGDWPSTFSTPSTTSFPR